MPFTPFHMGFALVAKATVSRYFSIPVFALTQVIIDAEVLVGLAFVGDLSNHAVLHNFAAAALVALLAVLLRRPVIQTRRSPLESPRPSTDGQPPAHGSPSVPDGHGGRT